MIRKSKLTLLVATSLTAGTALTQPASAGVTLSIKHNGISSAAPIIVTVGDRKSWTKVENGTFPHNVWITANGSEGERFAAYNLRQGLHAQSSDEPWTAQANFGVGAAPQSISTAVLVPGHTSKLTPVQRTQIIKGCNKFLHKGGTIYETHSFHYAAPVQMMVNWYSGSNATTNVGGLGGRFANGHALVKVVCKRAPEASPNIANNEPDFKLKKLEMFLSTFTGNETQPDQFHECKRGRILIRATTTIAGPVKLRLWSKIGDKPMQNEVIDAYAKFDGNSKYKVDVPKWVTVDKTSHMQARVEEIGGGTFAKEVGWKGINVPCVQIGSGGNFAGNGASQPDDSPITTPMKVAGKIHLLKETKKRADGSREGKVKIQLVSNKKGRTSYRLTCDGREWTGNAKTFKKSNGKYRGIAIHKFRFNKSFDMGCALRSTSMAGNPVIALGSRRYTIPKVNTNVSVGGNGQINDKPRPSVSKKKKKVFIGKVLKKNKRKALQKPQRKLKEKRKLRQSNRPFIKKHVKKKTSNRLIMKKRKRSSS